MASHSYPPTSSYCTLYRWSTAPDSLISWFGGRSVASTFLQTIWGMGLKRHTKKKQIKFRLTPTIYNVHINNYLQINQCLCERTHLISPCTWLIQYTERTPTHNENLLSQSKALQCNIRGQQGSSIWELHPDVCWVLSLTWGQKKLIMSKCCRSKSRDSVHVFFCNSFPSEFCSATYVKKRLFLSSYSLLTIIRGQGDEGDELGEDTLPDDGAGNKAGVVSCVLSFHFGDVQVPCLLRDKAPVICVQEKRELVVDPAVGHLLCEGKDRCTWTSCYPHKNYFSNGDMKACTYVARLLEGHTAEQLPVLLWHTLGLFPPGETPPQLRRMRTK